MKLGTWSIIALTTILAGTALICSRNAGRLSLSPPPPPNRQEVVLWHFWGGPDRDVVDDVVTRFNRSQTVYWVRSIAMPGNNLQAKLFLSVAGGDPPDLVNQDDPILADWAERGVIQPLDEIGGEEVHEVAEWMFDSARRLSSYNGKMYGVCNGLDIRAMYYNKTALDRWGLKPPETIADLDHISKTIAPTNDRQSFDRYAFLPDARRLWAWGYVFGGEFYDSSDHEVGIESAPIVDALAWMQSYAREYGPDNIAAFRQGDQSLPGKTFPLLPSESDSVVGRYSLIMDGQWRVRDIRNFRDHRRKLGLVSPEFGVCPLPTPQEGRRNAGWVNGNFFVVPAGAKCSKGAWAFIKFWIGFNDASQAAKTCAAGGWIPVAKPVVEDELFQEFIRANPMFAVFVRLAESPNQFPIPQVPGAAFLKRSIEGVGYEAMNDPGSSPAGILEMAKRRIQAHLDRALRDFETVTEVSPRD